MARPTTKQDLIKTANEQYEKLWGLINSMTEEKQETLFIFDIQNEKEAHWKRDKNIKDVLVHLYEWHQLLINWVNANQNGDTEPFLPNPYNWKTYGDMNVQFWEKHQDTTYKKAGEMVYESHIKVIKLIETFSNDELFGKGHFKWTGGSTLGQYCVSVTSSHYEWAMKKIKKQIKALENK